MKRLESIVKGMETIYKYIDVYEEREAIGIIIGVLVTYCLRKGISKEAILFDFGHTYEIMKNEGGDTN